MPDICGANQFGRCARWGGGIAILLLLIAIGAAPGSPSVSASGVTVRMPPGNTYTPADITVQQGTTVTWIDEDMSEPFHNVFEGFGTFGSPDLTYHQSYSFTFGANTPPGKYYYYCTYHGGMTGSVTVLAPATATPIPQTIRHIDAATALPVQMAPATHAAPIKGGAILVQPVRH